jgi:hypothetical protein
MQEEGGGCWMLDGVRAMLDVGCLMLDKIVNGEQ